jgi:long-chain acyl-CoA synthetase
MDTDLELYRREVRVASDPLVRLSAIDISPDHPQRTLIFLHGFGGQATQWRYQLQKYALENRVIALDLRGHGLSDAPTAGYDMEVLQRDLVAALAAMKVTEPFVLIGHSFGGAVAAEFATRNPGRVERLVLIATAGQFNLNPFYRLALSLPVSILRFIKPFTAAWLFAAPHALKAWYRETLSKWIGWDLYAALTVPTLVVRGHRDIVFEKPLFERVAKSIIGAEDVDIGSSGHMVMLERREAVNRALDRFLESAGQRSWREQPHSSVSGGRDPLRRERPWVVHYEIGVPYTVGVPRIPLQQLLRSAVRRFPNRAAIRFEGSALTYRQLNGEVNRVANALLGLGLGKGARVALLLPNVPQMIIGFYGVLKAGAVAVFLPPLTDPEELIRQARDSEASVLISLVQWAGLAQQIQTSAGIPHVVLTNAAHYLPFYKRWLARWHNRGLGYPGALRWHRWLGGQSNKSPAMEVTPEDLAVIQYTGGTTAESKGVMLSHRSLVANALQTRQWMPQAVEGRERFLCALPFSHSYGLTAALNVPISIGATLILKPVFNVTEVLQAVRHYKPTIFPGVPAMYVAINNFRGVRKYGVASIRACISGSAPLPVEVQEAFEKLTKGHLVEGYGLTEAGPITHANPLDGSGKVGSIGVPIPSTEARIVDLKNGRREMPVGQIGELAVRGPQVMLGYWKNPEATRKTLSEEGWLLTGDVAVQDADGFFRIIARKADMWYPDKPEHPAFPRDVEEVLYEIPQVKEAAVVAIAGQPIAFVITTRERPTSDAITAYCQRRLSPTLVPRMVIFMDDFPRTFIGKVLRRELAKRFEANELRTNKTS